jgi:CheY-like chemotaxis protein
MRRVILVVEDEWLVREDIAQALRVGGLAVLESPTGEGAIAYVQAGRHIDLVFTDIQLAGQLSGWDVAEQFRAARPDAPVIYTSGNSTDRSRSVTGSVFFDKPYFTADVVDACRRLAR